MIIHGDSLNVLREMEDNSIDAVVTDPPYGLGETSPAQVAECLQAWAAGETWTPTGRGFMGKSWDAWVPPPELWREVYRVLKHGGHALVFASSRTQDLMSISLRLAGFEVRDTLQWLYGSGFPKSLDVAKAIDKSLGVEHLREIIGRKTKITGQVITAKERANTTSHEGWRRPWMDDPEKVERALQITANASPEAEHWQGWGTALKPAYEPCILVRRPLIGTVAKNVLAHGTGALNIEGCRIKASDAQEGRSRHGGGLLQGASFQLKDSTSCMPAGRWPTNVLLDEEAALALDEQTRENTSRFFYCAKASKAEREAGLEGFTPKSWSEQGFRDNQSSHLSPRAGAGRTGARKNHHPTVKPIELMRYLCRMITPPDGVVLDPFCGSGSTLCAASMEGFRFIGIEREEEYVQIAQARVNHWTPEPTEPETTDYSDLPLFREER